MLERDAHQFLWDLGYVVFPRLKIYATKIRGTKTIEAMEVTDLDVYGIRFGPYLEKENFLIDCKHRSEGVFSQIIKSIGIASLLNIKNLLIIRESVKESVQRFSELFDFKLVNINEFRKRIRIREKGSFSRSSYSIVSDCESNLTRTGRTILARLSNAFVDPNPYRRFKSLRILYEEAKRELEGTLLENAIKLLLFRIFQITSVSLAEMASDTVHLSKFHFRNYLQSKMIGNIEFKLRAFERLASPDILDTLSKNDLSPLNPTYFDTLKESVNQLRLNSHCVQLYLRYNDFIIHSYGLNDANPQWNEIKAELGDVPRDLFSKWNHLVLQLLDDDKTFPSFLVKLLT